jgi:peptidyl-prolyl cis-trans isomerase A (cyclophilin A)
MPIFSESSFPAPTFFARFPRSPTAWAPRPPGQGSFIAAALLLALAACDGGPKPEAAASKAEPGPQAQAGVHSPTTKIEAPPAPPASAATDECCRYCFVGTPCGDECLPGATACATPEGEGCACTPDKRAPKQFRKGHQVPPQAGLIGPDVWSYNKAQGDPVDGPFTLAMAFEGAPELADTSKGTLTAVFDTSMGRFECVLYEEQAPLTVANFVGLARGLRPFKDPRDRRSTEWKKAPYYDGTLFHRVIEGFMLQGGDPTAMGIGTPGYFIPDEFDPKLRHDGPGYLSMANRNPYDPQTQKPIYDKETGLTVGNTGSAQFFVTVANTTALNDRHTIFGKCAPEVPLAISKVRTQSHPMKDKPFEDVVINKLEFVRK